MRRFLLLLSITLLAPCLPAQTLPADLRARSIQLLDSSSLSEKAWGAHLIAGLHLTDLQDRLIAELRTCQDLRDADIDGPEYAYVQKLLDALIQMDVIVPPDLILPFRRGHRAEVMILLLRDRGAEQSQLELLDGSVDDTEWLAIANTLVSRRSSRIFERLLAGLPVTHSFKVVDHESPRFGVGLMPDGLPPPLNLRRFPGIFPPTGIYALTRSRLDRAALLAHGPVMVFYIRSVVPSGGSAGCVEEGFGVASARRVEFRLQLLHALTGRPLNEIIEVFQPETKLRGRSAALLQIEISKKLDEQSAAIRSFVAGVKIRRETDLDSLRLEIKPEVHDHRELKSRPLLSPEPRIVEMDLNPALGQ